MAPGLKIDQFRDNDGALNTIYDGDTIPTGEAMPDAKTVAGGLALSKDGYCFYACLNNCVCQSCGDGCHIVDLQMVKASEIPRDWASTYFISV